MEGRPPPASERLHVYLCTDVRFHCQYKQTHWQVAPLTHFPPHGSGQHPCEVASPLQRQSTRAGWGQGFQSVHKFQVNRFNFEQSRVDCNKIY